jgi:hypothetical protein
VHLSLLARDRYLVTGLVLLVAFVSCVATAFAYIHNTNGVYHGLHGSLYPVGTTYPPGNQYSSAEVRHYFDNGDSYTQCAAVAFGDVDCNVNTAWGSAPCQKRYVGGSEGVMARHWVRLGSSCPGQIHA